MVKVILRAVALISILTALHISTGLSQTAPVPDASGGGELVSVLPFTIRGISPLDGSELRLNFASGLAESKRFTLLPDGMMKRRLEEAGLTNIDSCDKPPCLAQLGKTLHVGKIVHVDAARWDQRIMLHIRLVRTSDGTLLYDERVDYTGEFGSVLTGVAAEQGRKLSAAFLDKQPNWLLIGALAFIGVGLIYLIFTTWDSSSSKKSGNTPGAPST